MIEGFISQNTKDLIECSREIALNSGADGISSLHIFLADCSINNIFSLRNFAFKSDIEFDEFYKEQFIEPIINRKFTNEDAIPLTKPAEQAIQNARNQQKKTLDVKIEPYHIFLAMSKLKKSQFVSLFPKTYNLYDELLDYYKKIGCISYVKTENTLFDKIKGFFNKGN